MPALVAYIFIYNMTQFGMQSFQQKVILNPIVSPRIKCIAIINYEQVVIQSRLTPFSQLQLCDRDHWSILNFRLSMKEE
jgi:hypothetical protein